MPLRAVADDGNLFRLDQGKVGVVIVISLCHDFPGFSFVCDLGICLVPMRDDSSESETFGIMP